MLIKFIHCIRLLKQATHWKTGKTGGKKNQTASAPSDLPWVLKICMQEHTKRVGKKRSHSHALLISTSTDMNYASFAQSKCQNNHIFLKGSLDH